MSNEKPMKFNVKGNLRDLMAFSGLIKTRQKKFANASTKKAAPPFINILAQKLHPDRQYLKIKEIKQETKSTRTYRLIPDSSKGTTELAYFQAGQYLSVKIEVNGIPVTRPYSIASSPTDALNGFYDLTIKKMVGGFVTEYIWENWQVGSSVITSGPMGFLYFDPIRDNSSIVGIAGGSGITPFRSIAREICYGKLNAKLNILYGCSDEEDIIYHDELKELSQKFPDKIRFLLIMSCAEVHMIECEKGFISKQIIQKYTQPKSDSYFMCGPSVMYDFVEKELADLQIPHRQIRCESYGEIRDPSRFSGYPVTVKDKTFNIIVHFSDKLVKISALANESVLIALERAKLCPPSACRSGECQVCRTYLKSGKVWVNPKSDGRREADKRFGYIHPCASFPISDLEIILPPTDARK